MNRLLLLSLFILLYQHTNAQTIDCEPIYEELKKARLIEENNLNKISELETQATQIKTTLVNAKNKADQYRREKNKEKKEKERVIVINNYLEGEVQRLKEDSSRLEGRIVVLKDSLIQLENLIACIRGKQIERAEKRIAARTDLDHANYNYRNALSLGFDEEDRDSLIRTAWNTYRTYDLLSDTIRCSNAYERVSLPYIDDYKGAKEHANTANIINLELKDISDIILTAQEQGQNISTKICNRINLLNEILLKELGYAYAKSDVSFEGRQDIDKIRDRLDHLLIDVKRCDQVEDFLVSEIKKIYAYYQDGMYIKALKQYDKYGRLFAFKEIAEQEYLVNTAEYAVGAIIYWNLIRPSVYEELNFYDEILSANRFDRQSRALSLLEGVRDYKPNKGSKTSIDANTTEDKEDRKNLSQEAGILIAKKRNP